MSNGNDEIQVKIGIYSGLPNPEMKLTGNLATQLTDKIKSALGKEREHPPSQPRLGEFYGFVVEFPGNIQRQLDILGPLVLFAGVVSVVGKKETNHWRDVSGIETFLVQQAYKSGFGDLLKRLNVNEPG